MCIGATNQSVCPITALLGYLAICLKRSGPLFIFQDGFTLRKRGLSCPLAKFVGCGREQAAQLSYRAGTTAAKLGVPDSLIKMMGRWKLSVFMHYIRTLRQQLAGISSWLVQRDNQ